MNLLKTVVGRAAGGAIALAVIVGGVAWWQADPATRSATAAVAGRIVGWIVLVTALPWTLFALIGWVSRQNTNLPAMLLIGGLTVLEAALLGFLTHVFRHGDTTWILTAAAVVTAGVYNLLTCDWIAERFE